MQKNSYEKLFNFELFLNSFCKYLLYIFIKHLRLVDKI